MQINVDLIYPIGSLYLTTSTINPSILFGGTWEQITSDAYLKIVSSNAGSLGGTSSDHKIPIESMPSHSHKTRYGDTVGGDGSGYRYSNTTGISYQIVQSEGGGQAYYPYYYGVYVWKRVS